MKANTSDIPRGGRSARRRTAFRAAAAIVVVMAGAGWRYQDAGLQAETGEATNRTVATTGGDTAGADTLVALGEKVFKGKVGGAICTTCHGPGAKGMKGLGPDLTDGTWLHGNGSVAFLKSIIRSGVPNPREAGAPMPPYGGTPLKAEHLEAVAAYVYSLSH
jgi:mono/diheme cytochrome c family protein